MNQSRQLAGQKKYKSKYLNQNSRRLNSGFNFLFRIYLVLVIWFLVLGYWFLAWRWANRCPSSIND
jgi:hypothetical protein